MRSFPISLLLTGALATPGAAIAQRAVIVVRHAENAGDTLTETGRVQARRLATALENADVGAVYSTDSKRTIGTATPLADARELKIQLYDTAAEPGAPMRARSSSSFARTTPTAWSSWWATSRMARNSLSHHV